MLVSSSSRGNCRQILPRAESNDRCIDHNVANAGSIDELLHSHQRDSVMRNETRAVDDVRVSTGIAINMICQSHTSLTASFSGRFAEKVPRMGDEARAAAASA